jgi:integrase
MSAAPLAALAALVERESPPASPTSAPGAAAPRAAAPHAIDGLVPLALPARPAWPPGQSSQPWQWPLDLDTYDRAGTLTAAEVAELAYVAGRRGRQGHWPQRTVRALERLRRPLLDALAVTGADEQARCNVQAIVVGEMHRRQQSFWAWAPAAWHALLGDSVAGFQERYPRAPYTVRPHLIAAAYLLVRLTPNDLRAFGRFERVSLARKVFGRAPVDAAVERVVGALAGWGYSAATVRVEQRIRVAEALLARRSPRLEDVTADCLEALRRDEPSATARVGYVVLSRALYGLGLTDRALGKDYPPGTRWGHGDPTAGVAPEWAAWCRRWLETSTAAPKTRRGWYLLLLKGGRWLAATHPEVTAPTQWTRELVAAYVAAVDRMTIGQWGQARKLAPAVVGRPLSPRAKLHHLDALRAFFRDGQEWDWFPRRFDPQRTLAGPRAIRALIGPNPRVIADDIWAKLLWAGLNLEHTDLSVHAAHHQHHYPLHMVRAMALVWLFAGLRADEIRRLRVGCIRSQPTGEPLDMTGMPGVTGIDAAPAPAPAVCLLEVPTNKTSAAFTKPVDRAVGDAVAAWERVRPAQPPAVDRKTGDLAHHLFVYRSAVVSPEYLNKTLIPLLCRKAGVPREDARGRITSHRARSTIATQLFNAQEPLSLFELQAWLGHRTPSSTQQYAKIAPTRLAKAYTDAGYFARNLRTIAVLVDQDAVKSGAAASGEPWKFYDLGHGYCTYDFFDQCPHRMACAKCSFYRPKDSTQAQLLEGKANLLRLQQEIPLLEEERAAVEDGLAALEHLLATLADTPTPDGGPAPRHAPRQRPPRGLRQLPVLPARRSMRRRGSRPAVLARRGSYSKLRPPRSTQSR